MRNKLSTACFGISLTCLIYLILIAESLPIVMELFLLAILFVFVGVVLCDDL